MSKLLDWLIGELDGNEFSIIESAENYEGYYPETYYIDSETPLGVSMSQVIEVDSDGTARSFVDELMRVAEEFDIDSEVLKYASEYRRCREPISLSMVIVDMQEYKSGLMEFAKLADAKLKEKASIPD